MKQLICLIGCIILMQHTLEAQVSLRLLVNHSHTDTIFPGDPILLKLQLHNALASSASIHNNAVRQNLEILKLEFIEGVWTQAEYDVAKSDLEKAIKPVDPVSIAGDVLISGLVIYHNDAKMNAVNYTRCSDPPEEKEYVFTESQWLIMRFGIPPDETRGWNAGIHTIRIDLDTTRTRTAQVIVVADHPDLQPDNAKRVRLAYYHLECGDPAEALAIADQLLEKTSNSISALMLKADAYLALEENANALVLYEEALRQFLIQHPDSYEAPEYLLHQIAALQHRE